jgi:hypothetical protein
VVAVESKNILEVEVDGPCNESLYFQPWQRKLRGRMDLQRVKGPTHNIIDDWPKPIPGQRIVLNLDTAEAQIVEPLHDPEHEVTRERIKARKYKLGPAVEPLAGQQHLPTLLHWLKRAVESGIVKIIRGTIPDTIDGKPQLSFITGSEPNTGDRLADAMQRQTEALNKQTEMLAAVLAKLTK